MGKVESSLHEKREVEERKFKRAQHHSAREFESRKQEQDRNILSTWSVFGNHTTRRRAYHETARSSAMDFIGYIQWTITILCYLDFSFLVRDKIQCGMAELRMLKHLVHCQWRPSVVSE
ncbi:MAG: hypothetical protein Q9192_005034 [Flavoplaca navasiana]